MNNKFGGDLERFLTTDSGDWASAGRLKPANEKACTTKKLIIKHRQPMAIRLEQESVVFDFVMAAKLPNGTRLNHSTNFSSHLNPAENDFIRLSIRSSGRLLYLL